jgi:DNA-binding FadR family transcriptional regulator
MVSALYYERRRQTAERATGRNLHDAAEAHRRIYQAIRSRDARAAREAMNEHLLQSSAYQAQEAADEANAGTGPAQARPGAGQAKAGAKRVEPA